MKKHLIITPLLLALALPLPALATVKKPGYQDFTAWYQSRSQSELASDSQPEPMSEKTNILPYAATAIIDAQTFEPLHYHAESRVIPAASLTKLIAASTLELYPQQWNAPLIFNEADNETDLRPWVNPEDIIPIIGFEEDEWITREQAFAGMMIASANNAPYALARTSAYSMDEFVTVMNAVAKDYGMTQSVFVEPSGLSLDNLSSAKDMALGGCKAYRNEKTRQYSGYSYYKLQTNAGREKIFSHTLYGLRKDLDYSIYRAAKTGYLDETGYHVMAQLITPAGNEVCAVVMGADSRIRLDEVLLDMRQWVDTMYEF